MCFISLQIITELYRELEEKENEMENSDYERKKEDDKINRRSKTLTAYAFLYETVLLFSILHQFHKLTAGLDNYQFALPNLPGIIYDS